ncbi:MAG: hypothetical protein IKI61_04165 [Erysipelotrichaceae bacterium]|nr:hypothetical protein [Erysipelotrichaceae bacterium]
MLFSEADTEFEMNKLKNYYARIAVEEALKEKRDQLIKIMRKKCLSEEMINSICEELEK